MAESQQYTVTEPELQLCNEGRNENYSLHSFASIVDRNGAAKKFLGKISTMDDTSSTVCESTDQSSSTSSASGPLVKVVDRCYQQFKESDSYEVEYSLGEYESKLYLEDMKRRLDEPIIEEIGEDGEEEWERDYDYDGESNESIISLNTLEEDEFDDFVAQNCKLAPKMGCFGLIQMSLGVCHEEEQRLNEMYANDDDHLMRSRTYESSIYDEDLSYVPSEPVGEIFVTNEISFTKDSSAKNAEVVTGIDLTDAEPRLLGPSQCDDDEIVEEALVDEAQSETSDWDGDDNEDDEGAASQATTSIYLGTASLVPFDETESLILTTELNFLEDEESSPSTKLEPDGIKRRSHKDSRIEIQGFAQDPNDSRRTEDLEVLHLEPPNEIIFEA